MSVKGLRGQPALRGYLLDFYGTSYTNLVNGDTVTVNGVAYTCFRPGSGTPLLVSQAI